MARKTYRCDECGKYRVGVTVVKGRDLCPACLPPLPPSAIAGRPMNPDHRDPLILEKSGGGVATSGSVAPPPERPWWLRLLGLMPTVRPW